MKARRIKLKQQMMFQTWVCRFDTKPLAEGYGLTQAEARADALARAAKAGHKIIARGHLLYVLE